MSCCRLDQSGRTWCCAASKATTSPCCCCTPTPGGRRCRCRTCRPTLTRSRWTGPAMTARTLVTPRSSPAGDVWFGLVSADLRFLCRSRAVHLQRHSDRLLHRELLLPTSPPQVPDRSPVSRLAGNGHLHGAGRRAPQLLPLQSGYFRYLSDGHDT